MMPNGRHPINTIKSHEVNSIPTRDGNQTTWTKLILDCNQLKGCVWKRECLEFYRWQLCLTNKKQNTYSGFLKSWIPQSEMFCFLSGNYIRNLDGNLEEVLRMIKNAFSALFCCDQLTKWITTLQICSHGYWRFIKQTKHVSQNMFHLQWEVVNLCHVYNY